MIDLKLNTAMSATEDSHPIQIKVKTQYLEMQSAPQEARFAFSYTITIANQGLDSARLLNRHWIITDGNGKVQEVKGIGVIGQQPYLRPGESFSYTSGAVLETPVGYMRGDYEMQRDDGTRFLAPIDAFTLSTPRALH